MNIENGYSSWIHNHNTTGTGYGNRSAQSAKADSGRPVFGENAINDTDVANGEGTEKTKTEEKKSEDMTYREQILAHMEEMAKKIKDGTVEPTFQTGAQTFTVKEWEKLLADFDDAEEALQEQIKEIIAEVEEQAAKEALRRQVESGTADPGEMTNVSVPTAALPTVETAGSVANPKTDDGGSTAAPKVSTAVASSTAGSTANLGINPWELDGMDDNCTDVEVTDPEELVELLTGEVTKSTFPTDDPKHKHWFITCYGQDGIMCKEAYFDGTKWVNKDCWSLSYTEPGQREKVLAFIQRFPQDANLRFASHKEFWEDFLAGEIDEDDFVNFFETSTDENGVPNYTYEKDGSTYIDREKAKYAKYMNDHSFHAYTREEFDLIWRAVIHENGKHLQKISDHDGQMNVPKADEAGKNGKGKNAENEDDDLETKIITKPDGSTVLQIKTNFGVMEVEITEAQKFGLQYEAEVNSFGINFRDSLRELKINFTSAASQVRLFAENGEV